MECDWSYLKTFTKICLMKKISRILNLVLLEQILSFYFYFKTWKKRRTLLKSFNSISCKEILNCSKDQLFVLKPINNEKHLPQITSVLFHWRAFCQVWHNTQLILWQLTLPPWHLPFYTATPTPTNVS